MDRAGDRIIGGQARELGRLASVVAEQAGTIAGLRAERDAGDVGTISGTEAGRVVPHRLYAVPELARLIGESPEYLWRLARGKKLTVVKLPGKRMQIRGADWLRLVAASVVKAEAEGEESVEGEAGRTPKGPKTERPRTPRPLAVGAMSRRDDWKERVGL